jgi:hypothetical protein
MPRREYCVGCCGTCKKTAACAGAVAWLIWNPETSDEEDAYRIVCSRPDLGVEAWAAIWDCVQADYPIVRGDGAVTIVHVREEKEGAPLRKFQVFGRTEPSYVASEAS